MAVELKVPEVGESVTEVEIGRWLKKEGESVGKDDPLVEIETDKITLELPAPVAGVVSKVTRQQGDAAAVGDVIGYMEEGAGAPPNAEPTKSESKPEKAKPEKTSGESGEGAATAKPGKGAAKSTAVGKKSGSRNMATEVAMPESAVMPAAQRLLDENDLSAEEVQGTGPGARLLKEDVRRHVEAQRGRLAGDAQGATSVEVDGVPTVAKASSAEEVVEHREMGSREEETVPMSPMRRKIAQRLVEAQQTAALLTTFNEVDMSAVMALRNEYKEAFQKAHDVKLGFMSFFVKASIEALKAFPGVNAEVRGTNIVYKNYYDIGIAIGSGKGLVVPILRNAERMSFAQVEKAIGAYAQRIKENKLQLEDLQGGTFTITNGGVFGSMLSTPIINPPQSGVLGMHAITPRPVVVDGKVEIRPMMYLALTYDHRVVDGREAVSFLVKVKEGIEDPARILLEM